MMPHFLSVHSNPARSVIVPLLLSCQTSLNDQRNPQQQEHITALEILQHKFF